MAYYIENKTVAACIKNTKYDIKTVYNCYEKLRMVANNHINNENYMLGGESVEVEIDEIHLFTRKYHRGNTLASESVWVFEIV